MKTTKLALFNSVKGNYSQKSFQPQFEMPEVVTISRKLSADERNERLAQFKARKAMGKVKNFADAEYTALKSSDANFTMVVPNDVLNKFPEAKSEPIKRNGKTVSKKQLEREAHRSEIKAMRRG